MTEDGDIGYQIVYVKEDGEEVIMLPRDRVDSHQKIEAGEIVCIYSGKCKWFQNSGKTNFEFTHFSKSLLDVIEFDNSYSYFRSKKLCYSIDVIKSEQ
jgi:hypothetical protein